MARWEAALAGTAMICVGLSACGNSSAAHTGILASSGAEPILLFDGAGTSPGDVTAIEAVLNSRHLKYATADSLLLSAMSEAQLKLYRLLIIPGGNFEKIGQHLSASASARVRDAVQNGTNYMGFCAGAFFGGDSPYNGLNLTGGVQFHFFADVNRGIHKEAVTISMAPGEGLEVYWENGPELSGWGDVVGRYPDGTPAIVEGMSGKGWVIFSGVHPEAPEAWRQGLSFTTPASVDEAYAGTLIDAALHGTRLAHF